MLKITKAFLLVVFPALCGTSELKLTEGQVGSPVCVEIFEDLQCPDCATFQKMLDKDILPRFRQQVEFVHYDFPLRRHDWARRAAVTSRILAQASVDGALQYRRYMMSMQARITKDNVDQYLLTFVRQRHLDTRIQSNELSDPFFDKLVWADIHEGVNRNVTHTPTIFVGKRRFVEAVTARELSEAITQALDSVNSRFSPSKGHKQADQ